MQDKAVDLVDGDSKAIDPRIAEVTQRLVRPNAYRSVLRRRSFLSVRWCYLFRGVVGGTAIDTATQVPIPRPSHPTDTPIQTSPTSLRARQITQPSKDCNQVQST